MAPLPAREGVKVGASDAVTLVPGRSTSRPSLVRGGERFTDSALRLAGQAGALLGWRPHEFWAATPAELACVFGAMSAGDDMIAPPDHNEISNLQELFPDG